MADKKKRNTEDIRRDIYNQLAWDNRVGHTNIMVNVTDEGTVILSGMVKSHVDRFEAEEDAYTVSGVKHVENRLTVSLPPTYPVPGDEDITARVESLLQWNPTVDASQVQVIVTNGVLTLTGNVDSIWQKNRAGLLAEQIAGIISVDNRLEVRPRSRISDKEIRNDILATLARNTLIQALHVDVSVDEGVVTLSGMVDNHMTHRTVVAIATNTSGVIDVQDNLEIVL